MKYLGGFLIRTHALANAYTKVRVSIFAPSRPRNIDFSPDLEVLPFGRAFPAVIKENKVGYSL
jgi:hypothetical protein